MSPSLIIKRNFTKIPSFIKSNPIVAYFLVFGFFMVSFLIIYMNLPVLSSSDDHYFHFKFASRLLDNGFLHSFRDFKTIYFTGIAHGEHLLYYNFLFYLVLIPFTFVTPLFLAIKLFAIISVSLIGTILYFVFKKLHIKYAFLWSIGFFAAVGLSTFWRLFLSRPFVLSPFVILLLIIALHKKKYFWIFILSFIPLFWHTATFFVPILVSVIYFLCYGFYYRKYLWLELLLVILGTVSAIGVATIIDPGFFVSIRDNLFSVLSGVLNFSGAKVNIVEGGEVYPKNLFDLINQNVFLCSMFIISMVYYILFFLKEVKRVVLFDEITKAKKTITLVLFVLSTVFIVAIPNISNRFADFFIFFSWVFVALIFTDIFSYIKFSDVNAKKFAGGAVIVCLIYFFTNNLLQLNDTFATSGSHPETFSEVGNYLSKNLKKGEVVYNVTWNWFPQLYYYAPEQNYVIGLEPKLTYLYNPKIYWLWSNIAKGYVCDQENCPDIQQIDNRNLRDKTKYQAWIKEKGDNIANTVIDTFKSHYIVSASYYTRLNGVLNNSKRFEKVVDSGGQYFVYKVLP